MARRQRIAVLALILLAGGAGWFIGRIGDPRGMNPAAGDPGEARSEAYRERIQDLEREVASLQSRPEPIATLNPAPPPKPIAAEPKSAPIAPPTTVPTVPAAGFFVGPGLTFEGDASRAFDPAIQKGLVALREQAAHDAEEAVRETRRLLHSSDATDRLVGQSMLEEAPTAAFIPLLDEQLSAHEPPRNAAALTNAKARLKDRMWTAKQLTGAPDTPIGGDLGTAWASKGPNMGEVWIELDYPQAVRADQIRIHETFNPGAIARIYAKGPSGEWDLLWEGHGANAIAPRWFDPPISRTRYATSSIRIIVDTNRVDGWNEIDAVELIGDGLRQWALEARSQSSYADP